MKLKLTLFFFVYLIFHITINLVHPVTSFYVNSLELSPAYFGIFFSLMSLGQVVGAIIWGAWSDKIGRVKLISIGVLGYGLFQFLFGFVTIHPFIILVYRFLAGFFIAAPLTLFITYLVDISKKESRMRNVMIFTCLQILGSSLGYKIGGFINTNLKFSIAEVFITQIITCVVVAILSFILFNKEEQNIQEKSVRSKKFASFKNIKGIGITTLIFLITLTIVSIAQNNVSKYLDIYVPDSGYTSNDLGNIVLVSGVFGVVANIIMIPLLQKRIKEKYHIAFVITVAIGVVMLGLTFIPPSKYLMTLLYGPFMIYMMAKSVGTSMETSYLAKAAPKDKRGVILGIRQSFISLGSVIGPLFGSLLYQEDHRLWVFYVSILLLAVALVILLFLTRIINKNIKKTS